MTGRHARGGRPGGRLEDLVRPPPASSTDLYESNIYIPAETRQIKYNAVRARAVIGLGGRAGGSMLGVTSHRQTQLRYELDVLKRPLHARPLSCLSLHWASFIGDRAKYPDQNLGFRVDISTYLYLCD